nr:MAG TPA: hypothetical protein [Caudoviricetes sp.]
MMRCRIRRGSSADGCRGLSALQGQLCPCAACRD